MQKASLYFFSNQVKLKKDIPPKVYVKFEITVDYQPEKITDLSHVMWTGTLKYAWDWKVTF